MARCVTLDFTGPAPGARGDVLTYGVALSVSTAALGPPNHKCQP